MTMKIIGQWFDHGSAAQLDAVLEFQGERYQLITQTDIHRSGDIGLIAVSDRLGNVDRKLTLKDGSVFVTQDNQSVDKVFKELTKVNDFIHSFESNMGLVLIALVLCVATGFSFFKWGVPWVSHTVAHALPQKTGEIIGANTLGFLDGFLFEPSQLEEEQQKEIRNHFETKLVAKIINEQSIKYAIHFRAWGEGDDAIPNALALPSGDIILTDKFVQMSKSQDEIDSVLLHEMGHVVHKHSLEMVTQGTLITAVVALFTGDASGAADMGIGLGSLLLSTNYSRNNESEADQYAFEKMLQLGINPESFASIMGRITSQSNQIKSKQTESSNPSNKESSFIDYLSTHPNTQNRIEQAKRYALCYKKELSVCDSIEIKR